MMRNIDCGFAKVLSKVDKKESSFKTQVLLSCGINYKINVRD